MASFELFLIVRRDPSLLLENFGTYHLMGFYTLAPGKTRFQLYLGMVDVDVTPGKAPKNP